MRLHRKIVVYLVLIVSLCTLPLAPAYAGDPQGGTKGGETGPSAPPPDWIIYLILILPQF